MHFSTAQTMTIDAFLPLARMTDDAVLEASKIYQSAKPFPHIVFDNFFDPALLDQILAEFPASDKIKWQRFDNAQEIKLASSAEESFGPMTRLFLYHLNCITFLNFIGQVTGIDNLLPDPCFDGGGLHQIQRGGKLGIHVDYNKHRRYGLDRRLNLICYLNKDWQEDYGGHIELWDRDMKNCEAKVLPVFNRVLVFGTSSYTYHGHPNPLNCPDDRSRKSLALYYFSNGRPAEETTGEHSTLFQARSEQDFQPTVPQRLRALAHDILPPLITRKFEKNQ